MQVSAPMFSWVAFILWLIIHEFVHSQCLKRGLECIFPQESHRGQRVRKPGAERSESSQSLLSDEEGGQPKEASMDPAADSMPSATL